MILRSALLSQFPWLEHGFGTKAAPLSQHGMVSLQQVHSAQVLSASEKPGCAGEGDALIGGQPGAILSIRTADCLPILLVDAHRRAVAAIHAGWRGTAAGIVRETLDRMKSEFGTRPGNVFAAIGPGIGACCYEVGADVAARFGKPAGRLDLAAENQSQLEQARLQGIDTLVHCTRCDAHHFHSYRRDKESAGRMISFIGIPQAPQSTTR